MEIQSSKNKLILMLIACVAVVILAIKFSISPEQFTSYRYRSPELIRFFGIASTILCGSACIYFSIKLFDKKPGLIINDIGINDNSSAVSVGLILWKDIVSIRTEKVQSTSLLFIDVYDPEKYIERSNKIQKLLLKQTMRIYGSPISISSIGLKSNFKDLEKLIITEFSKHDKPNS